MWQGLSGLQPLPTLAELLTCPNLHWGWREERGGGEEGEGRDGEESGWDGIGWGGGPLVAGCWCAAAQSNSNAL